ncbi:hypothetical protein ES703_105366 [subsurface metagenome]
MVTAKPQRGDVLTVAAAAEGIGIHHATLYRWAQAGKVAYVIFGGMFFIPYTEVERLKKERNEQAAQGN